MWLYIVGFIVCAIIALDLMLRRGRKCHRVVDDPSLPLVIPSGGDPLWGIIRALWIALVTKQNDMVVLLKTIRTKPNPLKMLHSSFFGIKVLITWDPDVYKQVLNPRDDDTIKKGAAFVESFDRLIGKSVFSVDGQDWKRQRSVMTPAFHFDRLKRITPKFCVIADRLVQKWREFDDGQAVETLSWMSKMTLDALGLAGFGYDLHALDGSTDAAYLNYTFVLKEFANPLRAFPFYDKLNSEHNRTFDKACKDLISFLMGIVQERKAKGWNDDEDADLLHLLSEAHDSGAEGLSDDELAQNLFLFFLAGHETSSTTMNFVLYHLAKYPEHQEAALAEVQQILQGRHPTYDDAKNFKYLEAFIKESLRIFPPAPGLSRKLNHDTEIKGYLVPADTMIILVSYATQLSAEYFSEPDLFKPERWMNNEKLKHPFAYMPFGAGPRFCIGQYFAMLEMKIALAMILQNFRFSLAPGCEEVILTRTVTLQTPPGFKIRIHKRY